MHYPVSDPSGANAIVFTSHGVSHDADSSVVWIVLLTTWRVTVLERTFLPDHAWSLQPIPGLDLRLGSHVLVPEEAVHARLMGLIAKLVGMCRDSKRFDHLIVVGDSPLRLWFRRYLDASARVTILSEYEPHGLISKASMPTQRLNLCLQSQFPILFPIVTPASASGQIWPPSRGIRHDVLS